MEFSASASTVASASISGTCTTRISSVFFSASWNAESWKSRPQFIAGWKRQGLTRVFCSESRIDWTMGHAQKTANTAR